jgi:hypothetical protein
MKRLLFLLALMVAPAYGADLPVKALGPIPVQGCGTYFGLNTQGLAGTITTSIVPGASVVQGEIGAVLGYTCANTANSAFWFVEGTFDAANINGTSTGLNITGPADFMQRAGIGFTQLQSLLNFFPTLGTFSTPSLPVLPAGVTAGPASPYIYAGLHEQDISARFGLGSNTEWLLAPEIGAGARFRLSNSLVADVWAGWQMAQKGVCVGDARGFAGCGSIGNAARVGFSVLY